MIKSEKISYQIKGMPFIGYAVYDGDGAAKAKKPAVLVIHAWKGLDENAKKKAEELAKLGYVAFALDLYGNGTLPKTDEEAGALMSPLFIDRKVLRERLLAGLETLKNIPGVDTSRIGAIGFCFGGLSALELAKSGADVKGVVSFHGLLGNKRGNLQAKPEKNADKIIAKMLVLHGYEDPMVSPEDITNFQKGMTEAKVDWQMHIYSDTTHAFTDPNAQSKEKGLNYNPVSAKRAWQSMTNFFEELFA